MSDTQIQSLKAARAKANNDHGHDLHPFPPFFTKLNNGTRTACRACGRKGAIVIQGTGFRLEGLAFTEDCAPGSVKA